MRYFPYRNKTSNHLLFFFFGYNGSSLQCKSFSSWWFLLLWHKGSVVVTHRLTCFTACGIFLDQGLNPCSLYWQRDYSPLHHQGTPRSNIWNIGTDGRHAQRDPYDKTQQETIRTVIAPFSTRLWNGRWQWEMVTEKNWLYVGSVFLL